MQNGISDKTSLLTRDNSLILRGVAILFIVLHNFLHLGCFGFTGENEMSFSSENAAGFSNAISQGSSIIGEFISHLGWIGVPVFVFLTGYGVALASSQKLKPLIYVKRNYLKLLALILPAVIFFAAYDIYLGEIWPRLLKRFSYLTMLVNFAYPYVRCSPGVYWYFGLTFQFYLLWAIVGKRMNSRALLIWSIVLLGALCALCVYGPPEALSIFRHCFTGWFPVFALGVWLGVRKKQEDLTPKSVWIELVLLVVLLGLILLMSRWMITWIFVPIIALAWFIIIGLLLMRTCYLSKAFRWVGKYSACIFVCHPIARLIVLKTLYHHYSNNVVNVLVYVALSVMMAILYDKIYHWLLSKMLPKAAA
ncbi:MAG: acyltransferase [Bacteroidales bacterium]|nr:acyltransferase [Bacteroidales bacterium]